MEISTRDWPVVLQEVAARLCFKFELVDQASRWVATWTDRAGIPCVFRGKVDGCIEMREQPSLMAQQKLKNLIARENTRSGLSPIGEVNSDAIEWDGGVRSACEELGVAFHRYEFRKGWYAIRCRCEHEGAEYGQEWVLGEADEFASKINEIAQGFTDSFKPRKAAAPNPWPLRAK